MKIESIRIKRLHDDCPDLSYLESKVVNGIIDSCCYTQEDYDKDPKEIEKYIKRDKEELDNYGKTWETLGIQAEATVSYPTGLPSLSGSGSRKLEWFTSGGIWGINSNDESYLKEMEKEELEDLKEHLKKFGVPVDNFDSKIED